MKGLPHAIATGDPQNSTPESITQNDKVKEKKTVARSPEDCPPGKLGSASVAGFTLDSPHDLFLYGYLTGELL